MRWLIRPFFSPLIVLAIIVFQALDLRGWWVWPLAAALGFAVGEFEKAMERKLRREGRWDSKGRGTR